MALSLTGPLGSGAAVAPGTIGAQFLAQNPPIPGPTGGGGAGGLAGGLAGAANPYGAVAGAAAQALSAVGSQPGDANAATSGNQGNVENRINFGAFNVAGKGATSTQSTGLPTWAVLVIAGVAMIPVLILAMRKGH